jgi:hypothetical protein
MPVVMTAKDPQKDIVDPAVCGVKNVVNSVVRNRKTIKKFVYTSSLETIQDVISAKQGKTFTEEDWNTDAGTTADSIFFLFSPIFIL